MQRIFAPCLCICLALSCKTTPKDVNHRHTPRLNSQPAQAEADSSTEISQSVTRGEIDSVPPLPPPETTTQKAEPKVMIPVPEVGSECKAPVTANCLKIPYPVDVVSVLYLSPDVLKKYGRTLTPAEHSCAYFDKQLPAWESISYFPDAVVYWSNRDAGSVVYQALPINFLFAAGCEVGGEILNPYAAELKATTSWDGQSTLKSLGYKPGEHQKAPPSFALDKLKAEKVTQKSQTCAFAVRPLIYVFPDGVIYQFVGSTTLNIYPMTQIKQVPCSTPPGMMEAIAAVMPKCETNALNPDPSLRKSIKDLMIPHRSTLGIESARNYLTQDLINAIEINGKPISNKDLNCTFASRTKVHQFVDGIAFVNAGCTEANVYSNDFVKTKACTIPVLP